MKILKIIGIIFYFSVMTSICCVFSFNESSKKFLQNLYKNLIKMGFGGYVLLIFFQIILLVLGLPATIYGILLGIGLKNFILCLPIHFFVILLDCLICFFISRFLMKKQISEYFDKYKYYQGFKKFIYSRPIINLILIRLMYIPLFVKNYYVPTLEINFYIIVVISVIIDFSFTLWWIYLGTTINNIKKIFEMENITEDIFNSIFMVLTVAIAVYLAYFTYKKVKEIQNISDAENLENDEKMNYENIIN